MTTSDTNARGAACWRSRTQKIAFVHQDILSLILCGNNGATPEQPTVWTQMGPPPSLQELRQEVVACTEGLLEWTAGDGWQRQSVGMGQQ